jgi:hypothetical protein
MFRGEGQQDVMIRNEDLANSSKQENKAVCLCVIDIESPPKNTTNTKKLYKHIMKSPKDLSSWRDEPQSTKHETSQKQANNKIEIKHQLRK